MPKFARIPTIIEAEQYLGEDSNPKGLCKSNVCIIKGPHVHTIHRLSDCVKVEYGDWLIPEPDGIHFYPCKDAIFKITYTKVHSDSMYAA